MSDDKDDLQIRDNAQHWRFEAHLDGQLAGFSQYRLGPGRITFTHTKVDPDFEGQGIGSRLVRHALDEVRDRGLRVVPLCPFVSSYLRRHSQYADLVDEPPAAEMP
ncbi:GNAT family N-acetyltransferase [soil metagenome]